MMVLYIDGCCILLWIRSHDVLLYIVMDKVP